MFIDIIIIGLLIFAQLHFILFLSKLDLGQLLHLLLQSVFHRFLFNKPLMLVLLTAFPQNGVVGQELPDALAVFREFSTELRVGL